MAKLLTLHQTNRQIEVLPIHEFACNSFANHFTDKSYLGLAMDLKLVS